MRRSLAACAISDLSSTCRWLPVRFGEFVDTVRLEFTLRNGGSVELMINMLVQSRHDHLGEGYHLLLWEARLLKLDWPG